LENWEPQNPRTPRDCTGIVYVLLLSLYYTYYAQLYYETSHNIQTTICKSVYAMSQPLNNEELNDLYSSPNIVRVMKPRRMRWSGHMTRMGEERGCIGSWWGNRRERDHWGDLGVDGWILGWISRRRDVVIWTGLGWPRIETDGGRL